MNGLRAGTAKVNITPPVGIPLGGFASRVLPSQGIHDPLYARALALASEDKTVILIAADVLSVPKDIVGSVREAVQARTGVDGEGVMIAAIHTHSGPETIGLMADPCINAYMNILEKQLVGVAHMACRSMTDAMVGSGKGEAIIGFNRRKSGGPIDPDVGVIRVDDVKGTPRAAVVNYACHAVVLGPKNLLISADYPGCVNKVLERAKGRGFVSMFMNGAAGDINPLSSVGYDCPGTFRDAEQLGSIIAGEALKTLEQTKTSSEVQIRASSVTRRLLVGEASLAEAEQLVRDETQKITELRKGGAAPVEIAPHEALLRYYTRNLNHLRKGTVKDRGLAIEIQVIEINDVALVAVPGELFVEIGREIKAQSSVKNTFIIGYANGYIGYIPTPEAFEEGGYEPSRTWWNKATPKAGEVIKETCLKQLKAAQK